jgi:hypothetical protein
MIGGRESCLPNLKLDGSRCGIPAVLANDKKKIGMDMSF